MTTKPLIAALGLVATLGVSHPAAAQSSSTFLPASDTALDAVKDLVGRLDLEKYKATIKGLTQFGDRRQGTDRNRQAVDWIEAQLKSYGCTNTERMCCGLPLPPLAKCSSPGFAFAIATSSPIVFPANDGFAAIPKALPATRETGARSRSGS